jgi:hypothetical protein
VTDRDIPERRQSVDVFLAPNVRQHRALATFDHDGFALIALKVLRVDDVGDVSLDELLVVTVVVQLVTSTVLLLSAEILHAVRRTRARMHTNEGRFLRCQTAAGWFV